MKTAQLLEVLERVLSGVRSFGQVDGMTLYDDVSSLRKHFEHRSVNEIIDSSAELQAVSLVFDFEESRGEPITLKICQVGEALAKTEFGYVLAKLEGETEVDFRWGRQVVWALLAYALWHHRQNNLRKMDSILDSAEIFLNKLLGKTDQLLLGTRCRFTYYRGLQFRDQGDLEAATECFQESFRWAQARRHKISTLRQGNSDSKKARVEDLFSQSCVARVQAYGFGEIAFFRGDLAGSQAWFLTALTGLDRSGLERWRLSTQAYLNGSTILISSFTAEGRQQIVDAVGELDKIALTLANQHRAYADLAQAFSLLGQVRLAQASQAERDPYSAALNYTLPQAVLDKALDLCPSRHAADSSDSSHHVRRRGAISSMISLICAEVLIRGECFDEAQREIAWMRKQFEASQFVQVEADLLEAQVLAGESKWSEALRLLEQRSHDLHPRSNRNQRAFWFALASLASFESQRGRALSTAVFAQRSLSINGKVRHGFVNHFVQVVSQRVLLQTAMVGPAMPYQEDPPNFSLRDNEKATVRNTLRAISILHPSVSHLDELPRFVKYEKSKLHAEYGSEIDDWLKDRGRNALDG